MTATVYPVSTPEERDVAVQAAVQTLDAGRTAVIPTDTVYGIAADAFSAGGVQQLLDAKGRSRHMPPPVLIADAGVLPGLADGVSEDAQRLAEAFWPGALTLIVFAQPSLNWDLGETQGTVALRVPDDDLARELLRRTGPLAVSSANRTGRSAATDAQEALDQLGERVETILDGGPRPADRAAGTDSADVLPSTIVDATGENLVVVRQGAIPLADLRGVVPSVRTREEDDSAREQERADAAAEASEEPETGPVHGTGEGPRARAAEEGTLEAGLVAGASASRGPVDQARSRRAADETARSVRAEERDRATRPMGVDQARDLFFGSTAAPDGAERIEERNQTD